MNPFRNVLLIGSLLLFPLSLFALDQCASPTGCGASNGHNVLVNSLYPFSEDITSPISQPIGYVTISGPTFNWTLLATGCQNMSPAGTNIVAGGAFNARLMAYLQLAQATAAAGAEYEIQLRIDGVQHGQYVRRYNGLLPQGDHFNGTAENLSAGNHTFEIYGRLLSSGSLTFQQQYIASLGAPTSYPVLKEVNNGSFTVTGTWQQASDTVTFTNSSTIDLFPQAYFEINSGTPGHHMSFGFSLDGATSVRTSDFAAPNYYRDGINIFDHLMNIPPGTHTLSYWLIDRDGGTMAISLRQIELFSLPAASAHASNPLFYDAIDSTPVTTNPNSGLSPSFMTQAQGTVCGSWTKILEFTMPQAVGDFNWTGDGFIELLGQDSGDWTKAGIEMAIDVQASPTGGPNNGPISTDFHFVQENAPAGRGQIYFFADAMFWGAGYPSGTTFRLWVRKVTCDAAPGAFRIGKRYLGVKLVPSDGATCYVNH
jgi:hypothetical protein